jgi:6-phosphogluconolactonase
MKPESFLADATPITWSQALAACLSDRVAASLWARGACHVMLTGGRSATRLYAAWAPMLASVDRQGIVHFYFGDERCVPPDDPESNHRLALAALFPQGLPAWARMHRIEAEEADVDAAARRYAAALPERLDIVLLSMGDDGHIASLFPHGEGLHESTRRVLPVVGPKAPARRITVTPPVLHDARETFVMALGKHKQALHARLRDDPADIDTFPARLALGGTWIFGEP